MQTKKEYATELFNPGLNCAQAVLAPFCEEYGLDLETALKMTTGLGGGCNLGELCSAVTGAAIVIGLKYGRCTAENLVAKTNCDMKVAQFVEVFKALHGHVVCRDLLGYDLTTEEGKARKQATDRATSPCNTFVCSAVEILEKLGY